MKREFLSSIMMIDVSNLEISEKDEKRGLKIPHKMTPELAEDIGIMVGDGNIGIFKGGKTLSNYEVAVKGNMITDYKYIMSFIKPLKYELFGLDFYSCIRPGIKVCRIRVYSKGLVNFYHKVIGLPLGAKGQIGVPETIKESNKNIKIAFMRGLADTDF